PTSQPYHLSYTTLFRSLRPVAWPVKPKPRDGNSVSEAERAALAQQQQEASSAQSLWTRARKVEEALYGFSSFLRSPTCQAAERRDRKSTRLNSSHEWIS